jgi:hypothetical protein
MLYIATEIVASGPALGAHGAQAPECTLKYMRMAWHRATPMPVRAVNLCRYVWFASIAPHHGRDAPAADYVNMQMKHFLPAAWTCVDNGAEAVMQPLLLRQFGCQQQHLA